MEEGKIILSTNLLDRLKSKIMPGTRPAFDYLGTRIPIIENRILEPNSMIVTGEAAELFFNAFLGVLNQNTK